MEPDEAQRTTAPAGDRVPGTVTLERPAAAVAIITLVGEHDLSTRADIRETLARVGDEANVLVDLSDCSFIDSTVIGALVVAFQTLAERGLRLELAIPPEAAAVHRVAKVAGLTTFLAIHETRSAGVASISAI
jgi:anti-anti-sigma factor